VPRSIGEFRTTLRPIPLSEKLQEDHPTEDASGGALGVVFVLLEEDQVTDAGARAGRLPRPLRAPVRALVGARRPAADGGRPHAGRPRPPGRRPARGLHLRRGQHPVRRLPRLRQPDPRDLLDGPPWGEPRPAEQLALVQQVPGPVLRRQHRDLPLPGRRHPHPAAQSVSADYILPERGPILSPALSLCRRRSAAAAGRWWRPPWRGSGRRPRRWSRPGRRPRR